MDQQTYKEVYFDKYCKKCAHEKVKDTEAPCDECLGEPTNWNSHKPVNYERKGADAMNERSKTK